MLPQTCPYKGGTAVCPTPAGPHLIGQRGTEGSIQLAALRSGRPVLRHLSGVLPAARPGSSGVDAGGGQSSFAIPALQTLLLHCYALFSEVHGRGRSDRGIVNGMHAGALA